MNHYGQINNDSWHSEEQFTHFLNHSDDPQAVCLRGIQKDTTDKENWDKLVPKQYHDYGLVFSQKASEKIPTRKLYDHTIELLPDTQLPKLSKLYPLNPQECQSLNKWIDEELKKGYIRASKAPTAAPVFFVKKKDGKLRLIQDYCKLNAVTKNNKFPIPRISDMIDRLSQSSIFTSLDL